MSGSESLSVYTSSCWCVYLSVCVSVGVCVCVGACMYVNLY